MRGLPHRSFRKILRHLLVSYKVYLIQKFKPRSHKFNSAVATSNIVYSGIGILAKFYIYQIQSLVACLSQLPNAHVFFNLWLARDIIKLFMSFSLSTQPLSISLSHHFSFQPSSPRFALPTLITLNNCNNIFRHTKILHLLSHGSHFWGRTQRIPEIISCFTERLGSIKSHRLLFGTQSFLCRPHFTLVILHSIFQSQSMCRCVIFAASPHNSAFSLKPVFFPSIQCSKTQRDDKDDSNSSSYSYNFACRQPSIKQPS